MTSGTDPLLQIESAVFFVINLHLIGFCWKEMGPNRRGPLLAWPSLWIALALGSVLAMAGLFTWSFGIENALLAFEISVALLLSLTHPALALCFFLSLLFLRPWELLDSPPPLLLALPRLVGFIALASWGLQSLGKLRLEFHWNRSMLLFFAFAGWLFLATFRSPDPSAAQDEWFDTFLRALIIFVLCANAIRTRAELKLLLSVMLVSISGIALVSLYRYSQLPPELIASGERLQAIGNLANSNDIAAIMIMSLPLALHELFSGPLWPRSSSGHDRDALALSRLSALCGRLYALGFSILTLLAIGYSKSRGAYLAVALIATLWAGRWVLRRYRNIVAALLIGACLLCASLPVMRTIQRSQADLDASTDSRLNYWKTALIMAIKNPVLGVGFNQYPAQFETYTSTLRFEWGERTVHSSWFLALAESGFPGLFLMIAFFGDIFRKAVRMLPTEPALFYCIVGYGTVMTFLSHTYLIYPYILCGVVMAASRVYAGRESLS